MRAKHLRQSLFLASIFFAGGFARFCKPRTIASSSMFSEVTSSTSGIISPSPSPTEALSTTKIISSETAESTIISVPSNTETVSSVETTATLTTESTPATSAETSPIENAFTETSSAESTSVPILVTPTTLDSSTAIDTQTTPEATSIAETTPTDTVSDNVATTTTAIDLNPTLSTFYLNTDSSGTPSIDDKIVQGKVLAEENIYIVPFASGSSPLQFHVEETTNRLMIDGFYVLAGPTGILFLRLPTAALQGASYISCATPVRRGFPIQCSADNTGANEFVAFVRTSYTSVGIAKAGALATLPRFTFIAA